MNTHKKIIVITLLLGLILGYYGYTQELNDIEIQTFKTQTVGLTPYGLVVDYTTSDIYQGHLYIPIEWFRPQPAQESGIDPIKASKTYGSLSMERQPLVKATYINGALQSVLFIMPKEYDLYGIPDYLGNLSDEELLAKFNEQKVATRLLMESNE